MPVLEFQGILLFRKALRPVVDELGPTKFGLIEPGLIGPGPAESLRVSSPFSFLPTAAFAASLC